MFRGSGFWSKFLDALYEYEHPIASMMSMPIAIIILYLSVLWSVSAVGRHGIIPAIALVICFILMNLLEGKVSKGLIYVWIQSFICYAELIFIKYVFKANDADPGVGLIGWFVFAALTLILFAYTAYSLDLVDSAWGFTYIYPYGLAWILSLMHQHYVYYIVVYLVIFAILMTAYTFVRKKKNPQFDLADGSFLAGFILVVLTTVSFLHPVMVEENQIPRTLIDVVVSILEMSEI